MSDAIIWLIQYEGQTESAYTWHAHNYQSAVRYMKKLQAAHPGRKWDIIEKDVS